MAKVRRYKKSSKKAPREVRYKQDETPLIGEMWAKERISRYSAQYMLSDVGSCWSRGHAFSNQTVRMETDGTSEPALLQVDPGLTHSVQILFRSFEESASQIR
jgi:hypothetical protein